MAPVYRFGLFFTVFGHRYMHVSSKSSERSNCRTIIKTSKGKTVTLIDRNTVSQFENSLKLTNQTP